MLGTSSYCKGLGFIRSLPQDKYSIELHHRLLCDSELLTSSDTMMVEEEEVDGPVMEVVIPLTFLLAPCPTCCPSFSLENVKI